MSNIYWLRNDLRLHDNECLNAITSLPEKYLFVYIIDPRWYELLDLGFRKTSYRRFLFLQETLLDLRKNISSRGGKLLIKVGFPEKILPALANEQNAARLLFQREVTREEVDVEQAVLNALPGYCQSVPIWGATMVHCDDLPMDARQIPYPFTKYRKQIEKKLKVRMTFAIPASLDNHVLLSDWGKIPEARELGFEEVSIPTCKSYGGGETAGLNRLIDYTFTSQHLTQYRKTRNQSLGEDYSSKFSPWLSLGSLSPRQIYWTVKRYEKMVVKNSSTYWLIFELLWRDYFKFLALQSGATIFYSGGFRRRRVSWSQDTTLYDRWRDGKTGHPFIDAHMKQLSQEGYISNRGRVCCASFLTREYKVDWRWGAAWFEHHLVDYDVCSNWINWTIQAMETHEAEPVFQGTKYDTAGAYVKTYLPELQEIPRSIIHTPWQSSDLPDSYPLPHSFSEKWSNIDARTFRKDSR